VIIAIPTCGCRWSAKKNPITGSVVVADVVLADIATAGDIGCRKSKREIIALCREGWRNTRFRRDLLRAQLGRGRRAAKLAASICVSFMRNVVVTGGSRGLGLGIGKSSRKRLSRDRHWRQMNVRCSAMENAIARGRGRSALVPFDLPRAKDPALVKACARTRADNGLV